MDQPIASRPPAPEAPARSLLPDRSVGAPWDEVALVLLSADSADGVETALREALAQPDPGEPRLVWLTPEGASAPERATPAHDDGRRRFFEALAATRREVLALRARCEAQVEELAAARAQCRAVELQAKTDALTGLANRRAFLEQADRLHAVATRYGTPFAVVLLDVDHFKACNDVYGHVAGDAVLRGVADTLAAAVRHADLAARYGGEEFVVLCPNTSLGAAAQLAERLRRALEETLPMPDPEALIELPPGVTASVGVATWQAGDRTVDAVLKRADAALYQAKAGGRNRVELAPQ
jgi:diguanylate cyclase (GGDEF)-like protein